MKKTLLLSVVASTMIMAGGDIAPVEPVVEVAPVASAWTFSGQAVAYTQTIDAQGEGDLFGGDTTAGELGLQLRANNADLFAGIGFGAEVTAIGAGYNNGYSNTNLGLQEGSGLTQAYLTYGMESINTSLKVGRQTLPLALSPFAYSENWQAFQNTFDAALVVNSSIPDTTLVYAYVTQGNGSTGDIGDFSKIGVFGDAVTADDGAHMVTAQNKSIENLTLTGTWYIAPSMTSALLGGGDVNILWGDAAYAAESFGVAIQGGQISPDGLDETTAFGAKITGKLSMFSLMAAYSSVDDGVVRMENMTTNVKTPLYTQLILNQNAIKIDSDTFVVTAGMDALGGNFGLAYNYSDLGAAAMGSTFLGAGGEGEYTEVDLSYKTTVGENTTLFAAYVYQDDDRVADSQNFLRFWARYNF